MKVLLCFYERGCVSQHLHVEQSDLTVPHVVFKACSVICITDGQCRPMEDQPLSNLMMVTCGVLQSELLMHWMEKGLFLSLFTEQDQARVR